LCTVIYNEVNHLSCYNASLTSRLYLREASCLARYRSLFLGTVHDCDELVREDLGYHAEALQGTV
jgi:hypothetical protein